MIQIKMGHSRTLLCCILFIYYYSCAQVASKLTDCNINLSKLSNFQILTRRSELELYTAHNVKSSACQLHRGYSRL